MTHSAFDTQSVEIERKNILNLSSFKKVFGGCNYEVLIQ